MKVFGAGLSPVNAVAIHQVMPLIERLFQMTTQGLKDRAKAFCEVPLFKNEDSFVLNGNPFTRPLRGHVLEGVDFDQCLAKKDILSAASLAANRILFTVYELHYLLLPKTHFEGVWLSHWTLTSSCANSLP
jgi:hypothetical protein